MEALLAWIYPNRVLIAATTLGVLAVVAIVGWRRGWHLAARRHPRASSLGLVAILAVGLPVTWYLASPLVIRTELVEPEAATAAEAPVLEGIFVGADDFHFASGTARIVETAPGAFSLRFEAFSVRNGPDLYVYLSPDPAGNAEGAVELGTLKATDGSFSYDIPPEVDIATVRSVVIWCKAFSVPFGAASLTS